MGPLSFWLFRNMDCMRTEDPQVCNHGCRGAFRLPGRAIRPCNFPGAIVTTLYKGDYAGPLFKTHFAVCQEFLSMAHMAVSNNWEP